MSKTNKAEKHKKNTFNTETLTAAENAARVAMAMKEDSDVYCRGKLYAKFDKTTKADALAFDQRRAAL